MGNAAIALAAVLVAAGAGGARQAGEGFPDVPKTHWAYEAVTDLKARGILVGYPPAAEPAPAARTAPPPAKARTRPAPRTRRVRAGTHR